MSEEHGNQEEAARASVIGADELRAFAGSFATGVTVLTTRDAEGKFYGLTMNAVTCVCLVPPLFLVCVDRDATTLPPLLDSGVFAINILSRGQDSISNTFAAKGEEKFSGVPTTTGTLGVPLIDGALAAAEFRVTETFDAGDHVIVLGEAAASRVIEGEPLCYFRGRYAALDG